MLDEDEELDYDNEVAYEPELEGVFSDLREVLHQHGLNVGAEEGDEDDAGMRWDWDVPQPPTIMRRGHHHHHHAHGLHNMFGMFAGDTFRGNIDARVSILLVTDRSQALHSDRIVL